MAGYNGYSMSNNAVTAYADEEMPISKWSKKTILEMVQDNYDSQELSFDFQLFSKLKKENLVDYLKLTSWHHTSCKYNKTDFYSINYSLLAELTNKEIEEMLKRKKERHIKTDIEKQEEIRAKVIRSFEKIANATNQNKYFINETMVNQVSIQEIEERTTLLENLKTEYEKIKKTCNYKTLRGYVANEMKAKGLK